ncbi:MAG: tRNA (adenosine(37)-N6)-threonylcarbamoyltransferase complex ATPase subunit type 1 TsaE [Patescibacteria group bacterium]
MQKITTNSARQTKEIGFKLAKNIKGGTIIALIGDLGAGKTTFLQGLGSGLGVKQKILSPSFLQLKPYPVHSRPLKYLFHFDFYRLVSFSEVESRGLTEYLRSKNAVVVMEWADRIKKFLPAKVKYIYFTFIDPGRRSLLFKNFKKEELQFLSSFNKL